MLLFNHKKKEKDNKGAMKDLLERPTSRRACKTRTN